MNIKTFRQQHPHYDDLSDNALASALHKKYYADIPKQDFDKAFIGNPMHDDLEGAAVRAEDSLQIQNIDSSIKPVIVGTRDEILKLKQSGKIPKGRELFLAVPGKAYVIDPDGVQSIYGGSRIGALKKAKMDILKGNDSQLLGYPDRSKGDHTAVVTKQGDILIELPRISDAAKAGNLAYGAEGSPEDALSKAAQVSQAIRLKIPKKWKEIGNDSESEGRNEGQGLGQAASGEETGQSNGQGEMLNDSQQGTQAPQMTGGNP